MKLYPLYADVSVELPLERTFCYGIPDELVNDAEVGRRALVPFGSRSVTGHILKLLKEPPADIKIIKPITDVLDDVSAFDERRLKFYRWVSSYYFAPLGMVLALIHPAGTGVKSHRFITSIDGGADIAIADRCTPTQKEILVLAKNGITLPTLLRRLGGKPVYSSIEGLKKAGLITDETRLKGGSTGKTEDCFRVVISVDKISLKRSPIQLKVYEYLAARNAAVSAGELRSEFGNVTAALKSLKDKGIVTSESREVMRDPLEGASPREMAHEPNDEQASAIAQILGAFDKRTFAPFLLYGVTGSGKTLVYIKVLEEVLKSGKKAIFLAPEIALTPWPAAFLSSRFPGRVAVYHSGLSEGERNDEWKRIVRGDIGIVVGARSALFTPIRDVGIIIVDEEHETSYKQEDGVRYSARDCAVMMGKTLNIPVILGSATPSVETFHNAMTGKTAPIYMKKRVEDRPMPTIEIEDMRGKKSTLLSERLIDLMQAAQDDGNQIILFLNRRGFSNFVICRDCGHTFSCTNCSVTMTVHKRKSLLRCHYCDMTMALPDECPRCAGVNLEQPGTGTERVEEDVRALFPKARVGRMDRDTTERKGSAERIITVMENKGIDILIGTQMISKGHHFPSVSLVGIISGDTSLNIPDFRGSERTFQLITQAAGRAGRGGVPGKVVIQTLNPEHYAFRNALKHDYDAFFNEEIAAREECGYPPFTRLCNIRLEGTNEERVIRGADALKKMTLSLIKGREAGITILGPSKAPMEKLKGKYRYQMLIKASHTRLNTMHALIMGVKEGFEAKKLAGLSIIIDMDPLTTM